MTLNILIAGASGKMGGTFVNTCHTTDALELVAATSRRFAGTFIEEALGVKNEGKPTFAYADVDHAIANSLAPIHIGVELTHPSTVYANTLSMIAAGIRPIIGATGLREDEEQDIDEKLRAKGLSGMLVPNFSVGAVLMMRFAAEASKYFDHAEVIELHHNQKADAPSGTSLRTLSLMAKARGNDFGASNGEEDERLLGARGGTGPGNIQVHSIRLPGLVAHQEVLFGSEGQLLTVRHDSFNRDCFMQGIVLCCEKISDLPSGLHHGLETVM